MTERIDQEVEKLIKLLTGFDTAVPKSAGQTIGLRNITMAQMHQVPMIQQPIKPQVNATTQSPPLQAVSDPFKYVPISTTVTPMPSTTTTIKMIENSVPSFGKVSQAVKSFATVKEIDPVKPHGHHPPQVYYAPQNPQLQSLIVNELANSTIVTVPPPVQNVTVGYPAHSGMQLYILQQSLKKGLPTNPSAILTESVAPVSIGKSAFIPAVEAPKIVSDVTVVPLVPVAKANETVMPITKVVNKPLTVRNISNVVNKTQVRVPPTKVLNKPNPVSQANNESQSNISMPIANVTVTSKPIITTQKPIVKTKPTTTLPTTTVKPEPVAASLASIEELRLAIELQEKTMASLKSLKSTKQSKAAGPSSDPIQNIQNLLAAQPGTAGGPADLFLDYGANGTQQTAGPFDYYYDISPGASGPFTTTVAPVQMPTAPNSAWSPYNPPVLGKVMTVGRASDPFTYAIPSPPLPMPPKHQSANQKVSEQHPLPGSQATGSNLLQPATGKSAAAAAPSAPSGPTAADIASRRSVVMESLQENLSELNDMVADMQTSNSQATG